VSNTGRNSAAPTSAGRVTRDDVAHLSAMNARPGSARAFARTVHNVIDWRGQRHSFLERVGELDRLPPIAVFWGHNDAIIPFSHAKALRRSLVGVRITEFAACGHAPHREQPEVFLSALQAFLGSPHAPEARSWITHPGSAIDDIPKHFEPSQLPMKCASVPIPLARPVVSGDRWELHLGHGCHPVKWDPTST